MGLAGCLRGRWWAEAQSLQSCEEMAQGQAHDVGIAPLYLLYGAEVRILDGIGAGLVEGFTPGNVTSISWSA